MRTRGSGRIINVSSVLGFVPNPFMAVYASTKHAVEGYSESLDHEVREFGIRVVLVEPAYTRTSFDTNAIPADQPLALYARRRKIVEALMAEAIRSGDDPSVVGKAVVAAATDTRPKLRYPAGKLASRVSTLRRYAPATAFDRQIRKINRLAA
jgi:short-subunit dehydrogenase